MMKVFFLYKSVSGKRVPSVHIFATDSYEVAVKNLREKFRDSVTPIVHVFPQLVSDQEAKTLKTVFEVQLEHTRKNETGLRHSLQWVIDQL